MERNSPKNAKRSILKMDLTGLQIFKYLPGGQKTENANCKKCNQPTCMAFALKLAKKQVKIEDCPFVPAELKEAFLESVKVQQNEITFGAKNQIKTGGETVMFRHEKTLVNKTVIAVNLDCDDKNFEEKYKRIKSYKIERVGEEFKIDTIYLTGEKNIETAAQRLSDEGFSLIIKTDNPKNIDTLKPLNPIFHTEQPVPNDAISTVNGENILDIALQTTQKLNAGCKKIVISLNSENKTVSKLIEELTYIRRLSILNRDERFAYPVMVKIHADNDYQTLAQASLLMCRYANIITLDTFDEALVTSLFTLRQNIYTDPQKPLQVEPKIYEFGDPDENSIIIMTTNFALTYFAVANEIESLNRPAYLVITASDGMSVLTAWSAEKFTSELAAKTLKETDLYNRVKNHRIIIPGLLAHMKEELEEELEGWEIVVGPIEAYQLPEFIKNNF